MSFSFGLNVTPKAGGSSLPQPQNKASVFGDDDEADAPNALGEESITSFDGSSSKTQKRSAQLRPTKAAKTHPPPPSKPLDSSKSQYRDLASEVEAAKTISEAQATDPSIYDYDTFHSAQTAVRDSRKAAERQDAIERKPKYINNLLESAARRKQDQLVAREKVLQREREAEGDEFADKEKFVTGAYKAQQEAAREAEAKEKAAAEQEAQRRKKLGGGMAGFYRSVLGQKDQRHVEAKEAAALLERNGGVLPEEEGEKAQTDRELAEEMRAKGVSVTLNDEGQITDKRQLLSAGLNVGTGPKGAGGQGAEHLRSKPAQANPYRTARNDNAGRDARERQTRMMEAQLEAAAKRKAEEEDEERAAMERKAKSQKTESEVSSARERFLARKREREEAKAKEKA